MSYAIPAGSTTVSIPVLTLDDNVYEPVEETYTVTLSEVTINSPVPEEITVTDLEGIGGITDNGTDTTPTISIDDVTVLEGTTATFTATLSNPSQYDVSFNVTTGDVTAVSGSDYTGQSGLSYAIPAGSTTVSIPVLTLDDNVYEPVEETYTVTLSEVTINSPVPEEITATDLEGIGGITDNGTDTAPTISIDDITVLEGTTATFTATLSNPSQYDVSFNVTTGDVTAVSGSDYTGQSGLSYAIPAGSTTVSIPVLTLDDNVYEPVEETYTVTLSEVTINSPVPEEITVTDLEGIGSITDNGTDLAPTISIDDITVLEGTTATFTATLSNPSQYDVSFNVITSDVTAVSGSNYADQSGLSYTIPAGSTTVSIPVLTLDDNVYEPVEETYTVTLSEVTINSPVPEEITATDLEGIGGITDNGTDSAPTISINDVIVPEGATANFTVSLSNASQSDVTFEVSTTNITAIEGVDYIRQVNTNYTIPAGSTVVNISVGTLDDNIYEPEDETYAVVLSNVRINSVIQELITATDLEGIGTITDSGDQVPSISIDDVTVEEGEIADFTVSLTNASQHDITFEVITSDVMIMCLKTESYIRFLRVVPLSKFL